MSCTISFYRQVKVKATQGQVHLKKLSISNKYVRDLVDQRFHLVAPIFAKKFSQIAQFFFKKIGSLCMPTSPCPSLDPSLDATLT